jgi:hypothetical protein
MIRSNVAPDVVSTDNLTVADSFDWRDRRRRQRTNDNLRARSARGNEHEWNECEIFHVQNVGVEFAFAALGAGV